MKHCALPKSQPYNPMSPCLPTRGAGDDKKYLKLPATAAGLVFALVSPLHGQLFFSDNFNDGNDTSPAWIRYDPIGSHPQIPDQAVWTFPEGGYRIQTPPSPLPAQ